MPVSTRNLPFFSRTARPILSESGSVATIASAWTLSASSIASVNAFGSSGLGAVTVGKSPFGSRCCSTMLTFVMPASFNMCCTGRLPLPCRGVYTIFSVSPCSLTSSGRCITESVSR